MSAGAVVDHYERNDSVRADEIQNVRAFGSVDVLETIQDRVERIERFLSSDLSEYLTADADAGR